MKFSVIGAGIGIAICVFCVLIFWGAQSVFLNLAQSRIGPWRTMICSGIASCLTVVVVGVLGLIFVGEEKPFTWEGARYGLMAGLGGGAGVAALTCAFTIARVSGNNFASAWIGPIVGYLLPISQIFMTAFIMTALMMVAPQKGWRNQLLSPHFLMSVVFGILAAYYATKSRPE